MSMSIVFFDDGQSDGPFQIATGNGWAEIVEVSKDLPRLSELIESGQTTDTYALRKEIDELLARHFQSSTLRSTLNGLVEKLGIGSPSEEAVIV